MTIKAQTIEGSARIIVGLLAFAHVLGVAMFWNTNDAVNLAIPIALLVLVARLNLVSLVIATVLAVIGYSAGGIPFLDSTIDSDVRVLHLAEFLFLAGFAIHTFRKNVSTLMP